VVWGRKRSAINKDSPKQAKGEEGKSISPREQQGQVAAAAKLE